MQEIPSNVLIAIIDAQVRMVGLGTDLGAVMDATVTTAAELTNADGAVLELLEGEDIVYRAACGIAEPQLGLRMPVANSLSGYCLQNRISALCSDSEADNRVNRDACRRVGLRAMVIVPLVADDAAVAVLKLVWNTARTFEKNEAAIAQFLANMAAALMQRSTKEGAAVLRQRLTLDVATGKPNRSFFYEQLQAKIATIKSDAERFAIAIFRIDGLEGLSLRLGSSVNNVLAEISRRIEKECREGDVIARTGIDEFAVILSVAARRTIVASQTHRIGQSIAADPLVISQDLICRLTLRAGISLFPEDGQSASGLVRFGRAAVGKDGLNIELRVQSG